ncbi:transmembrane protein 17A isoform X1 [Hippocampus zosterae]|uniref:transmembrane protein 17A isoform X1 n=1 Tax=Hippocampus zosterae TaxID=109293 RepID=UPI00223D27F3|nr:transmembrane protein 17A isoform X1 [Hippocampus zosterae]
MPVFYSPVPHTVGNVGVGPAHTGTSHVDKERRDLSPSPSVSRSALPCGGGLPCDVALHMLIYFNVFYLPCWWFSSVCMLQVKFAYLPGYYQGLLISGIALVTIVEIVRLYLGYFGNLHENVAWLCCFCVLTVSFQLPVLLFFVTDEGVLILPLERAVHSLLLAAALAQIAAAALALRIMTRKLTLLFHLRQIAKVDSFGHAASAGAPVLGLGLAYRRVTVS